MFDFLINFMTPCDHKEIFQKESNLVCYFEGFLNGEDLIYLSLNNEEYHVEYGYTPDCCIYFLKTSYAKSTYNELGSAPVLGPIYVVYDDTHNQALGPFVKYAKFEVLSD